MRLIDADELKKCAVKVCFADMPKCVEFDAVGVPVIDIMPTIDPESLRPTAHWVETGEYVQTIDAVKIPVKICSGCHMDIALEEFESYCPNCGARMVNEDEKHCT